MSDQLQRQVTQLRRQLDAVRRIAMGLSSITKFEEVVQEALNLSLQVVDAGAGSIVLYDPEKNKLVFKYVVGEKADQLTGLAIDPDQGIAGKVFQSGESDISEDVTTRKEHLREVGERVGYVTQNMVTVALKGVESKPIGVMQVLNKADGQFDEYDVALLEIVGAQVAAALETARLHEEARAQLDEVAAEIGDEQIRERLTAAIDDLRSIYPEMIAIILEGCQAVQQRMAEISAAVKGIVAEPQFEVTDVVSVAQRVVSLLSAQAEKQGTTVVVESPPDMPRVVCDRKQVYNLIYNLLFNALDEAVGASHIAIRIKLGPSDAPFPEGSYFAIECEDNGSGMPEHVKAKLFTDEAVSTKPMGTGLGTRIVKNVVDAHGGTIEVWSEEGQGTRITCKIPATLGPTSDSSAQAR